MFSTRNFFHFFTYRFRFKKFDFAFIAASLAIIMLGLSYIAVPLYQIFCQTYGFGGTVQKISSLQSTKLEKIPGSSPLLTSNLTSNIPFSSPSSHNPSLSSLSLPSSSISSRSIIIHFSSDQAKDLPWVLKPSISHVQVFPGDTALTFYLAQNLSSDSLTGVATYNIIPSKAGVYFNKIQCFCFEEQRLKGHEFVELPVLFFIDSDFLLDPKMNDVDSITLSYTFFGTKPID